MSKNGNGWISSNWWKVVLAIALITSTCAGYAVLTKTVYDTETTVAAHSKAIVENEKSIIKLEAIQTQQAHNHIEVMGAINEISKKLPK